MQATVVLFVRRKHMRLNIATALPDSLADAPATALADELGGPTLFDLRRGNHPPLFVSVLLHGNEVSGWDALRGLLNEFRQISALLFLANLDAARDGVRALPGQVDFNRVWEGGHTAEAAVAAEVTARVASASPYLAVDIHNNTGRNPPYSVICRTDPRTLQFAGAFAGRALLASQPGGFQTRRFTRFCTAVTVEVGTPDDPDSTTRTTEFLTKLLASYPEAPRDTRNPGSLSLFETVARVTVTDGTEIEPAMQRFNFRRAPAGTALTRRGALSAQSADGTSIGGRYFTSDDGAAVLRRPTILAMYTRDLESARRDCLCYFLEPLDTKPDANPLRLSNA
ncbi:MAG: peptidase M14 [Gammaproteobacteria bacterium]|nr:succinylglutamate desuccinylase/aspartoacylase family protein [Gammaproteobacteria bacterium]MXY56691.1 peptidase M14 [Gammaproteobacteria bacterium]MYF27794.1 peptidase M14 [Gammaproteobacteria bacterium]MYK45712.1 peptidase M14 [Gammaproteobacteria bacterium]